MKLTLMISLMALSLSAFAEKLEIQSSDGTNSNISQIERSINVDNTNGRINVLEVDNGGSTDVGSAIFPSQLLVTYFQDGEMNNLRATFDLGSIYSLKAAKMKDKKTIVIDIDVKDLMFKLTSKKITVDISDLIKKAAKPKITVAEFETQTLDAKVISSERLSE